MKKLRTIHLYLGCLFAPMLIFFAVSGIWQTLPAKSVRNSATLAWLSTIHTGHALKAGTLSSIYMRWFVATMAVCLVITIILGVILAFKFGHKRAALGCLIGGIIVPAVLALLALPR